MRKIIFSSISGLSLAIFFLTINAFAQSATVTLRGTITDERGALISGASVLITDKEKAFDRTATTNDDGTFIFTQLAPSNYALKASKSGFAETQITNVALNVNEQKSLRVELKVATATATVNVTSEAKFSYFI